MDIGTRVGWHEVQLPGKDLVCWMGTIVEFQEHAGQKFALAKVPDRNYWYSAPVENFTILKEARVDVDRDHS